LFIIIYVAHSESCVYSYPSVSRYVIVWQTTIFISRVVLNILEGVSFFMTCHLGTENVGRSKGKRNRAFERVLPRSTFLPLSNERVI